MNKLVSRNPILRFKLGKKIVKALKGNLFIYYTGRDGKNYEAWRGGDNWYYRQKGGTGMTRMPYDYTTTSGQRFYSSTPRGAVANTYDVVNNMSKTSQSTPARTRTVVFPEEVDPNYTHNYLEALRKGWRRNPDGSWKAPSNVSSNVSNNLGQVQQTRTGGSSFRTAFDLARNSGLQEFTWNGKRYNTMKAGETKDLWLLNIKPQTLNVPLVDLSLVKPASFVLTPTLDPSLIKINVPTQSPNFNRSQVRDIMRSRGLNPYSFSGSQRKALRMYLNGLSKDVSQLGGDLTQFHSVGKDGIEYSNPHVRDLFDRVELRPENQFKFKNGGNLPSRNPIERFQLGNKMKRFSITKTKGGETRYFDTREEAKAYQRTLPQGSSFIRDNEEEWKGQVLRVDRTKDKSTEYKRQQVETPYNKLSFKDAYALARKNGVRWFGYKGKVYKSDLEGKAGKNNLTEMEAIYGNNLGWSKDPKLGTKSSLKAREGYRKEIQAKKARPVRPLDKPVTNKEISKKADEQVAKTWNSADFIDAISPQTAIGNFINMGASKLIGEKYTPQIYKAGYNVPGMAKDLVEGNYGDAAFRGLDAYLMFGAPGARVNLTPAGTNVTSGATVLPNGTRTFSLWHLNALGPKAVQPMNGVLRSSRGTTYFIDNGQFVRNLSAPALIAEPAVQQAYNIEK